MGEGGPGGRFPGPRSSFSLVLVVAGLLAAVFGARALISAATDSGAPERTLAAGSAQRAAQPFPTGGPGSAPSSPPRATKASPRGSLVIHGAGDVSLDPSYISTYRTNGYGYAWSGLGGLFQRDDLTVVNVECPVSNLGTEVSGKQFNFRGDPAALPAMRKAGVEVGNMANNHAYDYGPEALVDTRRNMLRAGIQPVGAGRDAAEAARPAIFHVNGWTIAVVGVDEVIDPDVEVATAAKPGTAAGHDFQAALAEVRAAKEQADLVVVDIHWGIELDTRPESYQVDQGHQLIEAGADVIFGGHSHRLQPLEMFRGRPIFYSLGNFVWPNFSSAGSTTAVAEVTVSSKGRFTARMIPAYIEASGHPVLRVS